MLVLKGTRRQIIKLVDRNPEETQAFLKVKPSTFLIAYLLNNTKIKTIYCSPGIYSTFTENMLRALKKLRIKVVQRRLKRGRPHEIPESKILEAKRLKPKGHSVDEICKRLGISRRTYYYRIKKGS